MNARTIAQNSTQPQLRFDEKFIEDHQLIERYLTDKLPARGARDLEQWCRANPAYLEGLQLSERAQMTLRLLESSGRPLDLAEPPPPWWRSVYIPIALAVLALASLAAFWSMFLKYEWLQREFDDTRTQMHQGPLVQPAVESSFYLAPDRAPGMDKARLSVNRSAPQLMDLHIDLSYTKLTQFRMIVDKQGQGRALILNNLGKDSNGELRLTFNTTALAGGTYAVRIEALPFKGSPIPLGWLALDVK